MASHNNFATISDDHLNTNNNHPSTGTVQLSNRNSNRQRNRNNPPRPCNCFILYRRDYQKKSKLRNNTHLPDLSFVSKTAAAKWAQESQEVKRKYLEKAQMEKEEHKRKYPNYVYRPKRMPKGSKLIKKSKISEGSLEKMSVEFLLNDERDTIQPCTNSNMQEWFF